MVIGIIVTSDRYPQHVVGLVRAALNRGHRVRVFTTDEGVRLALYPDLVSLNEDTAMDLIYCLHSAKQRGLVDSMPEGMQSGSQYNNAKLIQTSDRVITV